MHVEQPRIDVGLSERLAQQLFSDRETLQRIASWLLDNEQIVFIPGSERWTWFVEDGETGYAIGQGKYDDVIDAFAAVIEHIKARKAQHDDTGNEVKQYGGGKVVKTVKRSTATDADGNLIDIHD